MGSARDNPGYKGCNDYKDWVISNLLRRNSYSDQFTNTFVKSILMA